MRVVGASAEQGGGGLEEGGNQKVMRKKGDLESKR